VAEQDERCGHWRAVRHRELDESGRSGPVRTRSAGIGPAVEVLAASEPVRVWCRSRSERQGGQTMGKWSRAELEEAFENYQRLALEAGTSGSWDAWSAQFTEDATYIEHLYGTLGGREAIRRWITHTMSQSINRDMRYFPVEWYMIDEDRGWVIAQVWNRMIDPGDGSVHQAYNFTLLKYAGNLKWSYEEDIYNPAHFRDMIRGWMEKKKALSEKASG
jgi:hypothetical protein